MAKHKKTPGQKRLRPLHVVVLVVLVLAIGALGTLYYQHTHDKQVNDQTVGTTKAVNEKPSTPADNAANNTRKDNAATDVGTSSSIGTLDSPSSTPAFSVSVSRAYSSGQSITAAATVNGATTGTCTFTFAKTSSGSPVVSSKPEAVQTSGESALCPASTTTMPSSGDWYVGVTVTSNGQTASAESVTNPINL